MTTLPKQQAELISFFEAHVPVWLNDPTAIGLTLTTVTSIQGATVAARGAYDSAQVARDASKAATTTLHGAIDTLRGMGGPAINAIRAFAEGAADPMAVYSAAQIPPPADPTPAPAPEAPSDISLTLLLDGRIQLKWKAPQPVAGAEVFTEIQRRFNGAGSYAPLASTGEKTYFDATVPAGTQQVEYLLYARRGGQVSAPAGESILLGVPSNGQQGSLSLAA
ncbi:MAG: hypothetical protein ACF8R7_03275 [Phycisphaerales bacterium JB039]